MMNRKAILAYITLVLFSAIGQAAGLTGHLTERKLPFEDYDTLLQKTLPYPDYEYFSLAGLSPIQHDQTGFSTNNAVWLSELSLLSYNKEKLLREKITSLGLNYKYFYDLVTDAECFVVHNEEYIIVVFRGTKGSHSSWINNLRLRLVPFENGGKVHFGFLKALTNLRKLGLSAYLKALLHQFPDHSLLFTGHSKGGGLASLCATYFPHRTTSVYSFGSPRVGDQNFARSYHVNHYRVVNNWDLVPHLPPLFYKHTGVGVKILKDGTVKYIQPEIENQIDEDIVMEEISISERNQVQDFDFDQIPSLGLSQPQVQHGPKEWRVKVKPRKKIKDRLKDHLPVSYSIALWNRNLKLDT